MHENLNKILTTRVPKEVFSILSEIADERKRKLGEIIREALEVYIENWADYYIAVERLKDPKDKILSEKEFINELGWNI
ncbi:MAG: hypothetical protein ABIH00_01405 [Armatimonadota bacterium]